jgi:hypothetical protein
MGHPTWRRISGWASSRELNCGATAREQVGVAGTVGCSVGVWVGVSTVVGTGVGVAVAAAAVGTMVGVSVAGEVVGMRVSVGSGVLVGWGVCVFVGSGVSVGWGEDVSVACIVGVLAAASLVSLTCTVSATAVSNKPGSGVGVPSSLQAEAVRTRVPAIRWRILERMLTSRFLDLSAHAASVF